MRKYRLTEKRNIVVDTNVIVSALMSKESIPAKILEMMLSDRFNIYVTNEIIGEIKGVLDRPILRHNTNSPNELSARPISCLKAGVLRARTIVGEFVELKKSG